MQIIHTMRVSHIVKMTSTVGTWLLLVGVLSGPAWGKGPAEDYLRGPQGPYRGKVVDAETHQPIQGAVVVVVWQQENDHGVRVTFAALEGLTGPIGEFRVDGTVVETKPPLLALPPRFVIFAQGYTPLPETRQFPIGAPASLFRGEGSTVALRPTRTEEERIVSFNTLVHMLSGLHIWGDWPDLKPGVPEEHSGLVLLGQVMLREFEHFGFTVQEKELIPPKDALK